MGGGTHGTPSRLDALSRRAGLFHNTGEPRMQNDQQNKPRDQQQQGNPQQGGQNKPGQQQQGGQGKPGQQGGQQKPGQGGQHGGFEQDR